MEDINKYIEQKYIDFKFPLLKTTEDEVKEIINRIASRGVSGGALVSGPYEIRKIYINKLFFERVSLEINIRLKYGIKISDDEYNDIIKNIFNMIDHEYNFLISATRENANLARMDNLIFENYVLNNINTDLSNLKDTVKRKIEIGKFELDKMIKVNSPIKAQVYDAFLCHASEDKEEIANNLFLELKNKNKKIWYDDFVLKLGDSLRQKIDEGLKYSNYGIVILSKNFFNKNWPQIELDGLFDKEASLGRKVILPIWHKITKEEVQQQSHTLAGRFSAKTSEGLNTVVKKILEVIDNDKPDISDPDTLINEKGSLPIKSIKSSPIGTRRFLFVTANENETNALLEDKNFFNYTEIPSSKKSDVNFYNFGTFGAFEVVHFELIKQASINADAALLSISDAIEEFHPDAVVLVGIAFGKDYGEKGDYYQHIGDILVSEKVIDYESGKVNDNTIQSDGSLPECGRVLLSVFKHRKKEWHYRIGNREARCYFGSMLSGDKVVDDKDFKKQLFDRYPRAIGGEMEGRGAYAACRKNGLTEWVIIKGICDWGDGKKGKNKTTNQIIAAKSTVSYLKHVFSNPDNFQKIQKSLGKTIEQQFSDDEVRGFPDHNLIYLKNNHFTGRDEILKQIHRQFQNGGMISLTQTISGMGGVGKTQTALEFAYRYAREYDLVWWLISETPQTIMKAVSEFVTRKALAKPYDEESFIRGTFISWFDNNRKWLLIYDNVDSYEAIRPFLPRNSSNGNILITSRLTRGYLGTKIDIEVFTEQEAIAFLHERTGIIDKHHANLLSCRLGFFPLALEQAAAYINETPDMNFAEYLFLLDEFGLDVFEQAEQLTDYTLPVTATLKISVEKIQMESARQLLNLIAYWASDEIEVNLFADNNKLLPEPLKSDIENAIKWNKIIQELTKYSLVKCKDGQLSLHRLLQEVIRRGLANDTHWIIYDLNLFEKILDFDENSGETSSGFSRNISHAIAIADFSANILEDVDEISKVSDLYQKAGYGSLRKGDYKDALFYLHKALSIREKIFGENHTDTSMTYHYIGLVHKLQRRDEDALQWYQKALSARLKTLGKYDKHTAATYNNISIVYKNMEKYAEALDASEKSLEIKLQVQGANHRDTLLTRSNIANIYKHLNKTMLALQEHRKVLSARKKELGSEDKDTADSYGNITLIFDENGKYHPALHWFGKARIIQEKVFGEDHPNTAMTYYNIATVHEHLSDYNTAIPWYKKALAIQLEKLGYTHPDTLLTRSAMKRCDGNIITD